MAPSISQALSAATSKITKLYDKPVGKEGKLLTKRRDSIIQSRKALKRLHRALDHVIEGNGIQSDETSEVSQRWARIKTAVEQSEPMNVQDLVEQLTGDTTAMSLVQREEDAFVRLLVPLLVDDMDTLTSAGNPRAPLIQFENEDDDPVSVLMSIEQHVGEEASALVSFHTSHTNGIIRRVCKILFALRWEKASADFKRSYLVVSYPSVKKEERQRLWSKHYGGPNPNGEAARAGFKCDDEALQTKFKLWHEKHRTQRSFLLRLYRKFGAAVLLDPTWDLTTANDLPSHSKSCVQTLDYIERKVDDDFDLSALQKQSKAFLLQYLKTVNGDPVGEWTDRALTALE
jgi:hypothetical protein